VCTLCSCYPTDVLGLPPAWYKSFAYRSRTVKDPRGVLADFGVALPAETEIRVWGFNGRDPLPGRADASARNREIGARCSLPHLITRDCMIGAGLPKKPSELV
jgi:nitrile hydratase subunit alpha